MAKESARAAHAREDDDRAAPLHRILSHDLLASLEADYQYQVSPHDDVSVVMRMMSPDEASDPEALPMDRNRSRSQGDTCTRAPVSGGSESTSADQVSRARMAMRLVGFHVASMANALVALLCLPLVVLHLLPCHLRFCPVVLVERFAHWDLELANVVAPSPLKRRECALRRHEFSLWQELQRGASRKRTKHRVHGLRIWRVCLYFVVLRPPLAMLSLLVLLLAIVLPVVSLITWRDSGIRVPGFGNISLLVLPSLLLRPFFSLFRPVRRVPAYREPRDDEEESYAVAAPLLTYEEEPVAYVVLSFVVWITGVLGVLLVARLIQRVGEFFSPCRQKPRRGGKRRAKSKHSEQCFSGGSVESVAGHENGLGEGITRVCVAEDNGRVVRVEL